MPLNPPLREAPRFPVTSLVAIAAIVVSVRWWMGYGLSGLATTSGSILTQPWTLVTSIIPHVNPLHLLFNLSWWWVLGTRIERAWGAMRLIGVVLLLAVVSNGAEYATGATGVGLSGVVYGFCTLLWVVQSKYPALEGTVTRRTLELFGIWFVICIVLTVMKVLPVGNVAHGVGAICGWLLGKCIVAEPRRRAPWYGALVGAILLVGAGATVARPWTNMSRWFGSNASAGQVAIKEGRYDDAVRLLEAARQKSPRDAAVLINLGIAYMHKERPEEAMGVFKAAVGIDPAKRDWVAPSIASILDNQAAEAAKRGDTSAVRTLEMESLGWNPKGEYAGKLLEWARETEEEMKKEKEKKGGG